MLDVLLPNEMQRKAMQAMSLLSRVGIEGDVRPQGEALCEFIGISWQAFRDGVAKGVELGLIAKRGRHYHVAPDLLAAKLAAEVWDARPEAAYDLLELLPDHGSKTAFVKRMKDVGTQRQARGLVHHLLARNGLFRKLASLGMPENAELFQ